MGVGGGDDCCWFCCCCCIFVHDCWTIVEQKWNTGKIKCSLPYLIYQE
uniref:Uncharacterized protein n=1 Tax=Onchocerca volvulus TaxID=6282 RepID=A0A8R1TM58_ONCVO